jgi:hypothetical protein
MTDQQYLDWLSSNDACPCLLVEANVLTEEGEITRFLSNMGYTTSATDNPPHKNYDSVVVGGCEVDSTLGINGRSSLTVGDVVLSNVNGEIDGWLNDVWRGRPIKMFVGDMRWPRADFRQVFDGIIKDISPQNIGLLNLEIRDKMQRLNTAVSELKFGGNGTNADRLIPVLFGEGHNATPMLVDPATLRYRIHKAAMERLIEVRDNGVVVQSTPFLSTSEFQLLVSPVNGGQITVSAQGDSTGGYVNDISSIVQRLATQSPVDPFVTADLDTANLAAFAAAHPQPVGYYMTDRENVIDVSQKLAASVGAQPAISDLGKLQLLKVQLPAPGPVTTVEEYSMVGKSLTLLERIPVRAAVKLGYCPNWTVQNNLQTGLPDEHKDLYAQEWLTYTAVDQTVADKYKLTDEPVQENTYLLAKADAIAEANRRRDLWKVPRGIYQYEGFAELMLQQLGGAQLIKHRRYGMSTGKQAQIVGISKNWLKLRARIKVLA